jgi:hypothetical protein
MTGAELKSLEEFRGYIEALAARRIEERASVRAWHAAKRITYMCLLAGSFLFYYLIDKMHEALSLL